MDDSARVDDRRAKLTRLREQGIDPFPHQFEGVVPTSAVVDDLEPGEETDRVYRVAGRMVASSLTLAGSNDALAFGAAIALILAVTVLSVLIPLRRAARVTPVEALGSQ